MKNVLRKIWQSIKKGWMAFAHTLGRINTTILLTIFYFVLVGIYAIVIGVPKRIIQILRKQPTTYWLDHKAGRDYKYPF